MAVRAIGRVTTFQNNEEDGTVTAQGVATIVGDDFGNIGSPAYGFNVPNLDPDSLTLLQDAAAVIKEEMIASGIPFGFLNTDTVRLL